MYSFYLLFSTDYITVAPLKASTIWPFQDSPNMPSVVVTCT